MVNLLNLKPFKCCNSYWLSPRKTYVNVMDQYHPAGAVAHAGETARFAGLRRRITAEEFHAAMQVAREAGLARFDRER